MKENDRPPLASSSSERRRSRGKSRSSPPSWRSTTNQNSKSPDAKSLGINASSFHQSSSISTGMDSTSNCNRSNITNNKHARMAKSKPKAVKQALREASTSVVQQKRREVSTNLRLQRSAFKQVTSLKTWPLQDMAVKDFNNLLELHYDGYCGGITGTDEHAPTNTMIQSSQQQHDNAIDMTMAEMMQHGDSSTGLSSSSLDEPKRIRRPFPQQKLGGESGEEYSLSPRKSTMRHEFQQEFRNEAALVKPSPRSAFRTNLWCMEPRIFAVEKNAHGKRKYMVGHLGRFLDYYWRKCDARHRHYYELIREKTPCRLYFDIEYSKPANPDISQQESMELLEEFIAELSIEFERVYSIPNVNRSCIVDLDSSTHSKFSRHLIVHLPNNDALFADATAAGRFVRVLVGRLAEEAATGQLQKTRPILAKHLFVNTKPLTTTTTTSDKETPSASSSSKVGSSDNTNRNEKQRRDQETTCFVDMGVYTRNRLFRLLGSSKFGKPASAALRISDTNTFPFPDGFTNDCFYVPAMEARVRERRREQLQDDNDDDEQIDMDSEIAKFMSAVDWTDHATALGDTLVVPVNGTKLDLPILEESDEAKALMAASPSNNMSTPDSQDSVDGMHVVASQQTIASRSLHAGISPFPRVDEFILNEVGCRGEVQGAIRAWSVENDCKGLPQFITYQMSRNRYCERLGRPHRSNNIMWTVDLHSMQCTQSCHDPDCRALRFRGTPVDLPPKVRDEVADALFEQQLATMDENELTTAPPKKERGTTSDFDEEEFERALLALNIKGDDEPTSKEIVDKSNIQEEHEPSAELVPTAIELDTLSDDALLAAVESNPSLFP